MIPIEVFKSERIKILSNAVKKKINKRKQCSHITKIRLSVQYRVGRKQ